MGVLTEYGTIREITSGSTTNIAYILNDNNDFSLTEYKVLQSQNNTEFIKCMQMYYNGKIELYYLTSGHRTFTSMLPSLDENGFVIVVANLLNAIIGVKSNGFLSYQKIDTSFDKIFINPSNLSVGLIYVPTNIIVLKDFSSFETELRMNLVKLINNLPLLGTQKIKEFYAELSNGTLSLEELSSKIMAIAPNPNNADYKIQKSVMVLESLSSPVSPELIVNKEKYLIGKSDTEVDGFISYNNAISRIHCKIIRTSESYFLEDLESTNGTYLDNIRLQPYKPVSLKNGDVIRLANSDFKVRIK
ncbi:FHA domain-containing protein [Rossellomorea aquimaris]|uniref:FHA domain-containing protein n=1 Tax=Rossellomorea aquimaris TaxID=189382 RepID=UPI001CD3582E|nr:FHA domain-containing protein [Rossellomorea aquimaris]MCA1054923.1 FHA domain-containing protein [Rossellomorea aquimaris]